MNLLVEDLWSRRIVRVALGYVVWAVGLLVLLGWAGPAVGLPAWMPRLFAGVAFFGLPFVLVLIWALDDRGPQNLKPVRKRWRLDGEA